VPALSNGSLNLADSLVTDDHALWHFRPDVDQQFYAITVLQESQ